MLNFKAVTIESKNDITACLDLCEFRGADYNFSHIFLWSNIYKMEYAISGSLVSIYAVFDQPGYSYPAGEGDEFAMIDMLIEDAKKRGEKFVLRSIPKEKIEVLEERYPNTFIFDTTPDYSDYIYSKEKLETLSGKKLHSKRNHINRFIENNPNWKFELINKDNFDEVMTMSKEWCVLNNCYDDDGMKKEACVVELALENLEPLDLTGGLIRDNSGRVVGFSIGKPITKDTFGVHVEKAFYDIQGAYPMINQQFVIHVMDGFEFVNREEDTGDEGLRKAKTSYIPTMMFDRFEATFK